MSERKLRWIKRPRCFNLGTWAAILISLVFTSGVAESVGFDCAKARTLVEKTICADENLAKVDEAVNELYGPLLRDSFNPILLKQEQIYWLKNKRDKCDSAECIRQAYRKRRDQLNRWRRFTEMWDSTFAHIDFYDDAPPTDLLTDKTIGAKTREVTGDKFSLLEASLSTSSGNKIDKDGYLVANGCAPHVCSVAEARLVISKLGQIYVAILDADRILYFTNDRSRVDQPPESIRDFVRSRGGDKIYFMSRH